MPKTKLGMGSIWLIAAMLLLFVMGTSFTNLLYRAVPAGNSLWEDMAGRPALAFTMLAAIVAGIAASIVGLIAIIGQKERSLWVYISTLLGTLLFVFLIGESVFPH